MAEFNLPFDVNVGRTDRAPDKVAPTASLTLCPSVGHLIEWRAGFKVAKVEQSEDNKTPESNVSRGPPEPPEVDAELSQRTGAGNLAVLVRWRGGGGAGRAGRATPSFGHIINFASSSIVFGGANVAMSPSPWPSSSSWLS